MFETLKLERCSSHALARLSRRIYLIVMKSGVDVTTILAVQSLLDGSDSPDNWGMMCAGRLADAFIYSDQLSYPQHAEGTADPLLLQNLKSRDSKLIGPRKVEPTTLLAPRTDVSFEEESRIFSGFWDQSNLDALIGWIVFQNRHVTDHEKRMPSRYAFRDAFVGWENTARTHAMRLGLHGDNGLALYHYAFDTYLRFVTYADILGRDRAYIAHPIRALPRRNAVSDASSVLATAAGHRIVSFEKGVARKLSAVSGLTPQERIDLYGSTLHEIRGRVDQLGLQELIAQGADDQELLEVASKVADFADIPAELGGSIADDAEACLGGVFLAPFVKMGRFVFKRVSRKVDIDMGKYTAQGAQKIGIAKRVVWALDYGVSVVHPAISKAHRDALTKILNAE